MHCENVVTIDAPVDVVWRLTTDIENWPAVTPTVTRIVRLDSGPLRVGSRARIKQPRQSEAVWTVTRIADGREFTWQTRRLGLTLIGSHLLEAVDGGCRNTLTLDAVGLGSGLFGRVFGRLMRTAIETENAGLRARAQQERAAGPA